MRFTILSWLWLAFACNGISQGNQPPQFVPYSGPTVVYPDTYISFSLYAPGADYDLLAAPINTHMVVVNVGRGGEDGPLITWHTPPRSAVGITNLFVIRATSWADPTLSATCMVSLVVIDVPPIRSIALSNGVTVLQFTNPIPYFGQGYIVQWTDALPATNWSQLAIDESYYLPSITITDTNLPTPHRFYRLISYGGWCWGYCP
jgi:hypothetical protein